LELTCDQVAVSQARGEIVHIVQMETSPPMQVSCKSLQGRPSSLLLGLAVTCGGCLLEGKKRKSFCSPPFRARAGWAAGVTACFSSNFSVILKRTRPLSHPGACPFQLRTPLSVPFVEWGVSRLHAPSPRAIEPPLHLTISYRHIRARPLSHPEAGPSPFPDCMVLSGRPPPPCLAARGGGVRCCTFLHPMQQGHPARESPSYPYFTSLPSLHTSG